MTLQVTRCQYCDRRVALARDENGKRQILDLVSPVYQITDEGAANPIENICTRDRQAYVSHFATCLERDQARRAKP